MKNWHLVILAVLLASLPVLSACDLLGGSADKDRELYEQQIKAYQDAIDANNKASDEYNKALKEALEKSLKEYSEYRNQVQQQELQQQGIEYSVNQTQP